MSDVVSMSGKPIIAPGQPYQALIEDLEELLSKARAGTVTGIIYAIGYYDDRSSYQLAGHMTRGMIGALEIAKYKALGDDAESE